MDDSFLIQVLGDNKRPDSLYDLALFFYDKCSRNQDAYKLNDDKWWFVSIIDVWRKRSQTGENCTILHFKFLHIL